MIKLRTYQSDFIASIRTSFKQGRKHVCCVAGCGAGKTVLASFMCENHNKMNPNNYCWFLVHRQELIDQTISTFKNNGISMDRVMIGMVQTVGRHLDTLPKPTMIIFDEAHHILAKTWQKIIDKYNTVPVVGLTATPCRLDNKPLGNVFDCLAETVSVRWLIEHHYLSDFDYYAPKIDFEEKTKGNDYDQNFIGEQFLERKIYGDVLKYIKPEKKTIIYCPSIKFSQALADEINKNFGDIARHFDGDTPAKERKQIITDFRSGSIRILCNVDLIGEGFDVPDCDCCILLRPTLSLSLYIQQSMRCMRYKENKKALIIDMVGNCFRHGLPDEDREWSLDKKPKLHDNSGEKEKDVIVRECKHCFRVYRGNGRFCPYCGADNGKTKKQIQVEEEAELERITELNKKKERMEVGMAKDYGELVKIGIKRGYKNPSWWARQVLAARDKKASFIKRRSELVR